MVPTAASLNAVTPGLLVVSGLLLGTGDALSTPGRAALLADTGDRWGDGKAVVLLTWQDGLRRIGMLVGPSLAALAVSTGLTNGLLWVEAVAVLAAGLLACAVKGERAPAGTTTPSIRASVRGRPDVLYGWIARGTGCVTWFAFTLGLSVIGAERGQPGVYLAAGMTGYGVGSVLGTAMSLAVVRRVPPVLLAGSAWSIMGLCWVGMGVWTTPPVVVVLSAVSGVTVVLGISAISLLITRSSEGAERRALLSGQNVVVNAGSAAGMLAGGPIIAVAGAEHSLIGAGLLTSLVSGLLLVKALAGESAEKGSGRADAGYGGDDEDREVQPVVGRLADQQRP